MNLRTSLMNKMSKLLVLAALFVVPGVAQAETTDAQSDPELLLEEAVTWMEKKQFARACPKLEKVTQLVPEGIGAKLALGECYVGLGRLASASQQYMLADVLATRTHDPRAKDARFRWRILKPKLATITIFVVHSVRLLDGLAVYLDGVELGHDSWGTGIPVDMGTHHVRVDASGRRSWRGEVRIKADGEHRSATIPMLEVESNAITRMLWEPDFSPLRKGLIVAGTGLTIAGITSGIVFSVLMKEKQAEAMTATEAIRHRRSVNEMVCPVGRLDPACDELRGLVRERDTYNLGMALSFSFAGALIGTMGVMRLVSGKKAEPKDNRGAFAVVPSLSGISVMGKF